MQENGSLQFELPNHHLSSLPTGAVKSCTDALGRQIAHGEFGVGETIPMEAELKERFGVSRTVIREVVKVLSGKGLVRTARRYGTRVCPFDEWKLLDADVIRWHDAESPRAAEIYAAATELRCIVEPQAAYLAAQNASDRKKNLILNAAREIYPHSDAPDAMLAADYTFHSSILEASGNLMLGQLQGLILAMLQFSYPVGARSLPADRVSTDKHVEVAEAIKRGESEKACLTMQAMLDANRHVAEELKQSARHKA